MKIFISFIFLLFIILPLRAKTYTSSFVSGGVKRSFVVHEPSNFNPTKTYPLLIAIHGRLGDGDKMLKLTGFNEIADRENFIVVYPNGINKSWNDGRGATPASQKQINDVLFFSDLINYLNRNSKVDRRKIFLTGMSNGAFMTFRLACELPNMFRGIAAVSGTMSANQLNKCHGTRSLPTLIIHGTKDPLSQYQKRGRESNTLSVQETFKFWAKQNSCHPASKTSTSLNPSINDQTSIFKEEYLSCKTSLYTVVGGGHTWPGGPQYLPERIIGPGTRDLNASESIWEFFKRI